MLSARSITANWMLPPFGGSLKYTWALKLPRVPGAPATGIAPEPIIALPASSTR